MKQTLNTTENKIVYLEGASNYTIIYFECGKSHLSSYTLLRHQEKLGNFVRISRKHLVNPEFISLKKTEGVYPHIILKHGLILKISKRRAIIMKLENPIDEKCNMTVYKSSTEEFLKRELA